MLYERKKLFSPREASYYLLKRHWSVYGEISGQYRLGKLAEREGDKTWTERGRNWNILSKGGVVEIEKGPLGF